MFATYLYPTYRSWGIGYPAYGYPTFGYGGFPGYGGYGGIGGFGGYGRGIGINAIGSAIANQQLINTGSMAGVTQTANPTVIW